MCSTGTGGAGFPKDEISLLHGIPRNLISAVRGCFPTLGVSTRYHIGWQGVGLPQTKALTRLNLLLRSPTCRKRLHCIYVSLEVNLYG